jgi:hypothetical protein
MAERLHSVAQLDRQRLVLEERQHRRNSLGKGLARVIVVGIREQTFNAHNCRTHLINAAARLAFRDLASRDLLKLPALKRPAPRGPMLVDLAKRPAQRSAWLMEPLPLFDLQTASTQGSDLIAWLQHHLIEEHSITTQPAVQAETFGGLLSGAQARFS